MPWGSNHDDLTVLHDESADPWELKPPISLGLSWRMPKIFSDKGRKPELQFREVRLAESTY